MTPNGEGCRVPGLHPCSPTQIVIDLHAGWALAFVFVVVGCLIAVVLLNLHVWRTVGRNRDVDEELAEPSSAEQVPVKKPAARPPRVGRLRELAGRSSPGMDVRLLWRPETGELILSVRTEWDGEAFDVPVSHADALDAYHHPFAYVPTLPPDEARKPASELVP